MPKNVKAGELIIGGLPYRVALVPGLRAQDGTKLDGQLAISAALIEVDPYQDTLMQYQTLWHEIIHALLYHAGQREHDERLIDLLAFGITGTLYANGRTLVPPK